MGKRSRRTPAVQQKAIWDHESQIALLGLLDFCIQHQHTFPFEQDFVVGRLYPSGLPHKPYSWKQVKRKLFSLWKNYGQNDSPNKEEILRKGSTCFAELALTEDEKTLIKSVSERLEEELKPCILRKAPESPVVRDATPGSSFTIQGSENDSSNEKLNPKNSQTPRSQRYQTRELSMLSRKRTETPSHNLLEDETPKEHAQTAAKNRHKKHRLQENAGSEELDNPELGLFRTRKSSTRNYRTLKLSVSLQQSQQDPGPSVASLERMNKTALQMRDENIIQLEQTIATYERKAIELRNKLDSFRAVQDGNAQQIVFHLTQEVQSLKKAKEQYQRIAKFAALNGNYGAARKELDIEVHIAGIRHHMRNIVGGFDDNIILRCPGPGSTATLRGLLSFGFGLEDQVSFDEEQLQQCLSNHTPYTVIETLMEAAVCTWVLDSSFPDFAKQTGTLDLGVTYRKLLVAQGDSVALRSLDRAAHYDLINTPCFQKLLSEEAENLASFLSKILSPFFSRDGEESENNLFETWSEDELTWKERRERMVGMFKKSLTMKSNSLLTPEIYELINYPPGTLFNPSSMEIYGEIDFMTDEGSVVQHCMHVAIQAIPREPVKEEASVDEATVQPKNFKIVNDGEMSEATSAIILVKAVVVLIGMDDKES